MAGDSVFTLARLKEQFAQKSPALSRAGLKRNRRTFRRAWQRKRQSVWHGRHF